MSYRGIIAVFVAVVAMFVASVNWSFGAQKGQGAAVGRAAGGTKAGAAESGAAATTPGAAARPGAMIGTNQTAPVQGPSNPANVVLKNGNNANQFGNALRMGGVNGNPWISDMGARQQLQLTPQQYNQLSRAYQNAWNQYQQGVNALAPNLSPAERQQRILALESRFSQNYNRALDSTIANRRLRQRYNQLDRQFQGLNAFNDSLVRQGMNFTPAQTRQLNTLTEQWQQQMANLLGQSGNDPNLAALQYAKLQQQYQQQLGLALTPQQQQMWAEMTGQGYSFPWAVYNPSLNTATTNTNLPAQPPYVQPPVENTPPSPTEPAAPNGTSSPGSPAAPNGTSSPGSPAAPNGTSRHVARGRPRPAIEQMVPGQPVVQLDSHIFEFEVPYE